jgi:hypothetical protein
MISMRRAAIATAMVLGTTLTGVGAVASASPASVLNYDCSSGWFCTYDSTDGAVTSSQHHYNFQLGARDLTEIRYDGTTYNDKISSVYNLTNHIMCLYEHANGQGRILPIGPNFRGAVGPRYNFENITSSVGSANSRGVCDRTVPGA